MLAFVVAGAVPLLPYAIGGADPGRAYCSSALTFATLFLLGAARGVITGARWWVTGLEVLGLGAVAGTVAYGAGMAVAKMIAGG